jgi:hypothetical protein
MPDAAKAAFDGRGLHRQSRIFPKPNDHGRRDLLRFQISQEAPDIVGLPELVSKPSVRGQAAKYSNGANSPNGHLTGLVVDAYLSRKIPKSGVAGA